MHTITPDNAADLDRLARRRVAARLGWIGHAVVYLVVIGGMTAFAYWRDRHPPLGAALGWGLGLGVHGVRVFLGGIGSDLRERLVEAERQRLHSARRG
jgi:hypothetical protein